MGCEGLGICSGYSEWSIFHFYGGLIVLGFNGLGLYCRGEDRMEDMMKVGQLVFAETWFCFAAETMTSVGRGFLVWVCLSLIQG